MRMFCAPSLQDDKHQQQEEEQLFIEMDVDYGRKLQKYTRKDDLKKTTNKKTDKVRQDFMMLHDNTLRLLLSRSTPDDL